MSRLCVFTTGTDLDLLKQSCSRVNITLHEYMSTFKGYVSGKLRDGIKFLEGRTEPYIMWVDGNDSLIVKSETAILNRLSSMGNSMLISAEMTCWPDDHKKFDYSIRQQH